MREEELRKIMEELSIEEKIGQLIQLSGEFFDTDAMSVGPIQKLGIEEKMVSYAGSVLNVLGADKVRKIQSNYLKNSIHKIPLLFMADIVYGYKTIYPIPLALGCTWNPEMARQCNEKTAEEACAAGAHVTFAPMVDLVRDARWGRCMESTGEDTYLNSEFAKAMVEGFQGDFTAGKSLASCVKHFAGYGAAEGGREYNTVDISERRLREEYLPAYKAAVDAGCELVMTAFNTIDEIPATANEWLLDEILRKEWNFNGVVITDYAAIQELIMHGIAKDEREAAKLAINAKVDIDMKTACYANQLKPLLEDGQISIEKVNEAVWRVLCLKNKLGLFEDPYRGAEEEREKEVICCEENREMARKAATEAIVLLQNKNKVLPLSKRQKVALIGPYADSRELTGLWAVYAEKKYVESIKTVFEKELDESIFKYSKGCEILDSYEGLGNFGFFEKEASISKTHDEKEAEIEKAIELAKWADVVVFAMGEHTLQSGEAGSRTDLHLPEIQTAFLERVLPWVKSSVLLLFNGRPLVLTNVKDKADAILECWFPGSQGAEAIADIVFGRENPSGRLTMSFPYTVGQVPVYYNGFSTGRPLERSGHTNRFTSRYLDCPNNALYPFGYGLSYHTAKYSNLRLSTDKITEKEQLTASVDVTNMGTVSGKETVQLYIADKVGSVVRPVKQLKGFKKLSLNPGETKTVSFVIDCDMLKYHTKSMEYKAEEGEFVVMAGPDSEDLLKAEFRFI